jgi:hypothetical protein
MKTDATKTSKVSEISVEAALADSNARVWPEGHAEGRQGDVLITRLANDDPRLDSALMPTRVRRLDRVLARGSRAAHVCTEAADVYECDDGLLIVARERWALHHLDTDGQRHHPHVLPAGAYFSVQQIEVTPRGMVPVRD